MKIICIVFTVVLVCLGNTVPQWDNYDAVCKNYSVSDSNGLTESIHILEIQMDSLWKCSPPHLLQLRLKDDTLVLGSHAIGKAEDSLGLKPLSFIHVGNYLISFNPQDSLKLRSQFSMRENGTLYWEEVFSKKNQIRIPLEHDTYPLFFAIDVLSVDDSCQMLSFSEFLDLPERKYSKKTLKKFPLIEDYFDRQSPNQ